MQVTYAPLWDTLAVQAEHGKRGTRAGVRVKSDISPEGVGTTAKMDEPRLIVS